VGIKGVTSGKIIVNADISTEVHIIIITVKLPLLVNWEKKAVIIARRIIGTTAETYAII